MTARRLIGALAGLAALLPATASAALPPCEGFAAAPKTLVSGRGVLESAIVDRFGRLYFTDSSAGQLLRMRTPRSEPKVLIEGIASPGGLGFDSEGRLYVGYGDGFRDGIIGNVLPLSGLLRFDPKTGRAKTYISGLQMANGIAVGLDGAIYASNDVGTSIDRVFGGEVDNDWAAVISGNGLAVGRNGRRLFVNQTFQPASIKVVPIAHPERVRTYATPPPTEIAAGLDGMVIDAANRLYVAANGGGQVWRVDRGGAICGIASGLTFPSATALGRGPRGFSEGNVYVVTFGGEVIALGQDAALRTNAN